MNQQEGTETNYDWGRGYMDGCYNTLAQLISEVEKMIEDVAKKGEKNDNWLIGRDDERWPAFGKTVKESRWEITVRLIGEKMALCEVAEFLKSKLPK